MTSATLSIPAKIDPITMEVVQNADHLNVQQYRLYNKNDTQMRFRGF